MSLSKFFVLIIFFYLSFSGYSQNKNLHFNPTVYNSEDSTVKKILIRWEKCLNGDVPLEIIEHQDNRLQLIGFCSDAISPDYQYILLNVRNIKDNIFELKTLSYTNSETNGINIIAVFNILAICDDNKIRFIDPFLYNLKEWTLIEKNSICLHMPPSISFDFPIIDSLEKFNRKMANLFEVRPIPFSYVLFESYSKLWEIAGFDFRDDMFTTSQQRGIALTPTNIILSSIPVHSHEIVHLYIRQKWGEKANNWFNEGVATFLGGHRGEPLKHHLQKIYFFLQNNPKINLKNLLEYQKVDDYADFRYIIGGEICKLIYEIHGINGIYSALSTADDSKSIYDYIEVSLNVNRNDLHAFLIENIKKDIK